MKIAVHTMLCLLLVALFLGCGGGEDASVKVAKSFWQAMEERDIDKARSFATEATAATLTLNNDEENKEVDIIFGEAKIEDGQSHVPTTMKTTEKGQSITVPMETVLVKEEGEWRVDVNLTMMSLFGGAMGAMMDTMKDGMEEMGKAMAEGMKDSFEELEKQSKKDD